MNAEEIADELFDIMCDSNNVEEPAGRGCGYGFTEDGQEQVLAVIKRILPQKTSRKEQDMSETTTTPVFVAVKTRQAYKVTATATVLTIHPDTCMLTETEKKPILDDARYEGLASEALAIYLATKDIEVMLAEDPEYKGIKLEDVEVTARPF